MKVEFYQNKIAYNHITGKQGSILFCGGFGSSMDGTKATALYEFCKANDIAFTRFDYTAHGQSKGQFGECTISSWLNDTSNILTNCTTGKQIVIGSSMGGWLMLLLALKHPDKIKSLIGIAAAPDFTRDIYNACTDIQKEQMKQQGYTLFPSEKEGNPYFISNQLIQDGVKNLLLNKQSIPIKLPIILLHGMQDITVHYTKSLELATKLESDNVLVQLIKSSDHSMNDHNSLNILYNSIFRSLGLNKTGS